ncbi:MAG: beta-galactosidase [Streptosporangiaceae bacterium]|nr:beta-galactosidase [Streptosporangiaceae bacterium]
MIAFGGDYNPEQWPEEIWAEDMALMKEAGVTLVTVGVFSWAQVQAGPDDFRFGWLDRVMDLLADSGVAADLATMTASPPPWLTRLHPEILPVRQDGTVLSPGGRQHFSPSSHVYRRYAAELVERLATRYADHPALAMWHIGNEFGCHVSASYDDESAGAFRGWLRDRYGDVEALNDAWSTAFWSQRYTDFEEVLPPRVAATYPNPAQQLDFARFSNDAMLACYQAEAAILRRITPAVRVTTNFLSLLKPVDVHKWSPHTDIAAVDCYPDPADPRSYLWAGLTYDIIRSARGGQPWLLMEHPTSAVNWRQVNVPQRPGQLRVTSLQAVAHGADAVLYFQWRQSRGGAEKFHSGMVPHAGPDSRIFTEVKALGAELAAVPGLAGTRISNEVSLLLDWESWWASELDSRPSALTSQPDALMSCYAPLFERGIGVDVVHPDADLSRYKVVVVPSLYLLRAATASRLADWTRAGGQLVVTFLTGIVDECDRIHLGGYLGPLAPVLGVTVEEHVPLPEGAHVTLAPSGTGTMWSERVILRGATAIGTFSGGDLAGEPAVTRHAFGSGTAWYLATRPDAATMAAVLDPALAAADVRPALGGLPHGVQAARRGPYLILLNHAAQAAEIRLPSPMVNAADGATVSGVALGPFGTAILR